MLNKLKKRSYLGYKKVTHNGLGVLLVGLLALVSNYLGSSVWVEALGISTLSVAIMLGILITNSGAKHIVNYAEQGIDFCKNVLLRAGIVLYGFQITFQQITIVGYAGLVIAILMIISTFSLAVIIGMKVFKLDKETVVLIGVGSSICGAAAIMATEPLIKGQAHKVSVAVATVVVFGTLAMLIYPLLYAWMGLSEQLYGIYVGASIHEVAQVVVAGKSISEHAAATAVIEKMLRVMLLAPFLMVLSSVLRDHKRSPERGKTAPIIPWFALLFVAATAVNSMFTVPAALLSLIKSLDVLLLTMAMAALGLRTHLSAIKQAGVRPLLLAGCLFVFLLVGGLITSEMVTYLMSK